MAGRREGHAGALTKQYPNPVSARTSAFASCGHAVAYAVVSFVPNSRPEQVQQTMCANARLLEHLVGAAEQGWRHVEAKRPNGLQVDHEFELDR
jgi:hypothetical protein